jgi:hypothetical protein
LLLFAGTSPPTTIRLSPLESGSDRSRLARNWRANRDLAAFEMFGGDAGMEVLGPPLSETDAAS